MDKGLNISAKEMVDSQNPSVPRNLGLNRSSDGSLCISSLFVIVTSFISLMCDPTSAQPVEIDQTKAQSTEDTTTPTAEPNNIPTNPLKQAKEAFAKGDPNDFGLRYDLGKALRAAGLYKEALEQFLWCFDEGPKHDSNQAHVRTSFLLSEISQMDGHYPPAIQALVDRREAASSGIQELPPPNLSGHPSREYFEKATKLVGDFSALNRYISDDANTLSLFQQLLGNPDRYSVVLEDLANRNLELFIENGLHEEISDVADVLHIAKYSMSIHKLLMRSDGLREELTLKDGDIERSKDRIFMCYEVLLAVQRTNDAYSVANELVDLWDEPQTYYVLAVSGLRSKKPTSANVSQVLTAIEREHRNIAYYKTYVQLLQSRGETDQAIQLAESHIDDPTLLATVKDKIATTLKDLPP